MLIELADKDWFIVTSPVIVPPSIINAEAVISPSSLRLKFDELINIYLSSGSFPANGLPLIKKFVDDNECDVIANPPNSPELAVRCPDIETAEAVIEPSDFNFNTSPTAISPLATAKPATSPPLKERAEALTIPVASTLKSEADIKSSVPVAEPLMKNVGFSCVPANRESSFILNEPIEAETNLAKPSEVIAALAVSILLPAGVKIALALILALITASEPITNLSFLGSKWNNEELISILESEPLTNCVPSVPIKNLSVLISNKLGFVLNLKKEFALP